MELTPAINCDASICSGCNASSCDIYIDILTGKDYLYCDKCYKNNLDRIYEMLRLYFVLKKTLMVNIPYSLPLGSNRIRRYRGSL